MTEQQNCARDVPHTIPAVDEESSDDESSPAEPINPPVTEQPLYSNQEGPNPPSNASWKPRLGSFGALVVFLLVLWGYDLLPVMHDKCTTLDGLQGAISAFETRGLGFVSFLFGASRR
jgi:hypothetical protein